MGRRVALSNLATATVEAVPGHSAAILERLDPARIAPTPLNKRTNFGTPEEMTELGESIRRRQLQPVVVVSRERYLAQYPEHEEQISKHEQQAGPADYVLVNGERRWRAVRQVGVPRLEAMIRDEIADSRADLLEAVIAENIDRRNLDPIEEARSVEELVTECGSAAAAAKHLRRTEGWVSQRRALLKLIPEIQARVQAGEVPVRIARSIASVPPDEQEAALKDAVNSQPAKRATRRREPRRKDPEDPPTDPGPGQEPGPGAVGQPGSPAAPAGRTAVTEEADAADPDIGEDLPWDSPAALAALIRSKLTPGNLAELLQLLAA